MIKATALFGLLMVPSLVSAANSADVEKYIDELSVSLEGCRTVYEVEIMSMKQDAELAALDKSLEDGNDSRLLMRIWKNNAYQEIQKNKETNGYDYMKCRDDAKSNTKVTAKKFLGSVKGDKLRSLVKGILAQWFTAMDVIAEREFRQELTAFKSKSNDLKLEIMLN
jgi:hypothetical protein